MRSVEFRVSVSVADDAPSGDLLADAFLEDLMDLDDWHEQATGSGMRWIESFDNCEAVEQ